MPDRTRPIRKEICLNEQEFSVVRHKMNQLSTRNFGAYARKMLIDGYIIKVDYTEQKKLAAAGQSQHFPPERLRRAGRHHPAVLYLGAGTDKAPPQPPERHADLPGAGVQRLDRSTQAGFGQTRPHHAELPSGRKADSAKRGWRNIARIKVENKVFFAPQALRKHRGISFPLIVPKCA